MKRVPVGVTFTALAFLEILPIHTGWIMVDEFCSRFVYFYAGYAFAPAIFRAADWLRQRPLIGVAGLLVWGLIEYKFVFMPVPESLAALISPASDLLDGRGAISDLPVVSLLRARWVRWQSFAYLRSSACCRPETGCIKA